MKKNPIISYFRESKEELEKTSWPTQKETIRYTVATIAVTALMAVLFALLDAGLGLGLLELIKLSGSSDTVPNLDISPVVESIESDDGTIDAEILDEDGNVIELDGEGSDDSTDEEASDEESSEDNE